jgi:hypothetical protein
MIRLRPLLVIAALSLLTSAATAHAECAWVLWLSPLKANPPRWDSSSAFTTLEDCTRQATAMFNDFNPKHPNAMVEARCLPDTVDPRGPNGK